MQSRKENKNLGGSGQIGLKSDILALLISGRRFIMKLPQTTTIQYWKTQILLQPKNTQRKK